MAVARLSMLRRSQQQSKCNPYPRSHPHPRPHPRPHLHSSRVSQTSASSKTPATLPSNFTVVTHPLTHPVWFFCYVGTAISRHVCQSRTSSLTFQQRTTLGRVSQAARLCVCLRLQPWHTAKKTHVKTHVTKTHVKPQVIKETSSAANSRTKHLARTHSQDQTPCTHA